MGVPSSAKKALILDHTIALGHRSGEITSAIAVFQKSAAAIDLICVNTRFERRVLCLILALTFCVSKISARLIPVKHKEGTSHGFIVLRSQEGQDLATGDTIETVQGENVTSEMVLHFKDGSVYDEVTTFSQRKEFHLISDHLREEGKSFPNPVNELINVATGDVEVSSVKKGTPKSEHHRLQIPEDAANGLMVTLLKNLSPSEPETTVSIVSTSSKPRVVKLKIHAEGKQPFSASGERLEAIHYVVHTDIGGVAGAVAPIIGKQPSDIHIWVVGGKAPTFVKFTGQLFEGGPVWNIELATVKWEDNSLANEKK